MIFSKIRQLVGLETDEEKSQRFERVEECFEKSNQEIDELAKDFFIEKSMFEQRMKEPDNYSIQERIQEKFDLFLHDHKNRIKKAKKVYSGLKKEKEDLEKSLSSYQAPVADPYSRIKKAYQSGQISLDSFNTIIKGITKEEKTKYADFIVLNENNELLLIKRAKWEDENMGAWCLPGGHVDPGEEFEHAAVRELAEETNLLVDQYENVGSYQDANTHIEYYQTTINTNDKEPVLEWQEARDYKWVPWNEIREEKMIFNMAENVLRILGLVNRHKEIIKKTLETDNMKKESIDTIKKAFESGLIDYETFEKALRNLSHLVQKKVQVKGKDGKVYQATRWVDPTTGESVKTTSPKKEADAGDSDIEMIENIISSSASGSDKVRQLINSGIYDPAVLSLLSGILPGAAKYYLTKEAEVDPSQFNKALNNKVKNKIREEQSNNDTSEGREDNKFLRAQPLNELWENYRNSLLTVINKKWKFAIAYGKGGVGKTYTFNQLVKEKQLREFDDEIQPDKDQYDFVRVGGKITPSQVYAEMYRHRDKLIVFDDCDSFLKMTEVQGFLKGGLDTSGDNKIDNKSGMPLYNIQGDKESGKIPNSFKFTGRVIAITNLLTKDIDGAIFTRAIPSNLSMTVDETMQKLGEIKDRIEIWNSDKTELLDVSTESRDLAFKILGDMKDKVGSAINTRLYASAALQAQVSFELGQPEDRVIRNLKSHYSNATGEEDMLIRQSSKK